MRKSWADKADEEVNGPKTLLIACAWIALVIAIVFGGLIGAEKGWFS